MKIFITGATGFLGYHIADAAVREGHEIMCLCRSTSNFLFEQIIEDKIEWLNNADRDFNQKLADFAPDVLIHCAWGGVRGTDRDDAKIQQKNVIFSEKIIKAYPYKQIISLGSQAEYGYYNAIVKENHPLNPINQYGLAKIKVLEELRFFAQRNHIDWQWIRVFTVFGEKQRYGLIYSFVKKCLMEDKTFETSPGMQEYSYMYSFDFAKAIMKVVGQREKSGIYNLSQNLELHTNRYILDNIKRILNSDIEIKYGSIPYAKNQVMLMEGDTNKFIDAFGKIPQSNFLSVLEHTVKTYQE